MSQPFARQLFLGHLLYGRKGLEFIVLFYDSGAKLSLAGLPASSSVGAPILVPRQQDFGLGEEVATAGGKHIWIKPSHSRMWEPSSALIKISGRLAFPGAVQSDFR
jgi:hypothetical protein